MKKILVPCDFSKPAINAFRMALDFAVQSKGAIHLLNVIEMPVLHDSTLMPTLNFQEEFMKEMRQNAESEFGKLIAKYNKENSRVVSTVQYGSVNTAILDYLTEHAIDMIVMGSHGASGFREFFIGSNAEKIVRRSSVPVLIVKNYNKGPVKNIVFPNTLDTEDQEELVLRVKALQDFFQATLHVVWINTPLNFTSDSITLARLNQFAKRFMLKDFTIHVFNHNDPEEGILNFAEHIKGDLIAMGTHGRKGMAHVISGSLAENVVNHTEKLVWTYTLNQG